MSFFFPRCSPCAILGSDREGAAAEVREWAAAPERLTEEMECQDFSPSDATADGEGPFFHSCLECRDSLKFPFSVYSRGLQEEYIEKFSHVQIPAMDLDLGGDSSGLLLGNSLQAEDLVGTGDSICVDGTGSAIDADIEMVDKRPVRDTEDQEVDMEQFQKEIELLMSQLAENYVESLFSRLGNESHDSEMSTLEASGTAVTGEEITGAKASLPTSSASPAKPCADKAEHLAVKAEPPADKDQRKGLRVLAQFSPRCLIPCCC